MNTEVSNKAYIGYEYKRVTIKEEQISFYLESYKNFGWIIDQNIPVIREHGQMLIQLKRDRKISNKMELTRLERNFEACAEELEVLEKSKTTIPTILATSVGLLGTAFMAGAVFAVTAEPPVVWLCILLAIPGFCGWILPCFIYHRGVATRTERIKPFIEVKYDEVYELCKKGHSLL